MDVPGLSQRYTNLYIPSDFFNAHVKWGETFPPQTPFSLNNPCGYHIMSRDIESPNPNDAVLEPPDADYRFSAKVKLYFKFKKENKLSDTQYNVKLIFGFHYNFFPLSIYLRLC